MATPTFTVSDQVTALYNILLGRAPDATGLTFWQSAISTGGKSLADVAGSFVSNPTYVANFGSLTNAQYVQMLYTNMGSSGDTAGIAFWTAALSNGMSRTSMAASFVTSALSFDATSAAAQALSAADLAAATARQTTLQNKVAVSEQFIVSLGSATVPATTNPDLLTLDAAYKASQAIIAGVTSDAATKTAALAFLANGGTISSINTTGAAGIVATPTGTTYTLTTGTDTFTGTTANDTFTASVAVVIDPATGNAANVDTMQAVDSLAGGAGIDTLNFVTKGGAATLPGTVSGVEIINAQSLAALTIDTSSVSGLTNLNVTKAAGAVTATAAATTDVSVAMTAANAAVTLAGGNNITVNLSGVTAAADVVNVGVGAAADAAGDVIVTTAGVAYTASTPNTTLSAVNVTGGKTITVTEVAAASITAAASDTTNTTITEGAVTVIGNANTSSVSVKQDATVVAANATYKTGGVTETASVKFGALKSGDVLVVAGLTFTASADMTAADVASAFASLLNNAAYAAPASVAAGDTQGSAAASKGTYTVNSSAWTSGVASGDTVVFTSTTANTDVVDLAPALTNTSGSSVAPVVTTTSGKANDTGATGGVMGVTAGVVSITDANATIKTITVDGYGSGSTTTTTSVLETLNLANGAAAATMVVADTANTLALNVEKVGTSAGDAVLTFTAAPTTLNVKSTGNNYVNLTAALTETLNVSGTGVFKADATDLAALKTVKVTETAGLKLNAAVANTITSVDTTATTGAVTVTIEGARATYAGGAGVDTVTLATDTALTKSISLGAGDDSLSFAALAVTGSTATLSGGDGIDTLSMSVAAADALDATTQTFYTGFERLVLNTAAGSDNDTLQTVTLDLAKLGFTNYVTTSGTVPDTTTVGNSDTLLLDKMASGGTVVLTANGLIQVNVTDAATVLTDSLNVVLSSTGNLDAGKLTAANVETVNISTVDTETATPQTKNVDSLILTADKATTVNISGAQDLTLTLTGSTKVTNIDGSTMTGGLTVTSLNTTSATTIHGGSGNDVLTAATGTTADVLLGGAGNDVLVANAGLDTLTGGQGNDLFRIATASLNSSSYATITDFAAGDLLQIAGATSFAASKIVQGDTAVFQDYCNAAMNASAANAVSWFQYGGNTYVLMDAGANSTTFVNGEDYIVKLTGLVDLTNASFNNTSDTIAL